MNMPPNITPMFTMPVTLPARRAGTDSLANANVRTKAPLAIAVATSSATSAAGGRPGTKSTAAQSAIVAATPPT
ncbi:hypothetical protein D3C83_145510 [compost metagenome]